MQFEPANNSIDDSKISSISSSKISDLNTSLAAYLLKTEIKAPTIQKFLSGSGTYSTPIGVRYIKVKMVGGAGGYLEATISSPNATYSYSVGNGGTPSGTVPGGAGGSGLIIVEEFYQ